jgi:hypothetical protein
VKVESTVSGAYFVSGLEMVVAGDPMRMKSAIA